MGYTHLHNHTQGSTLDGYADVSELVDRAVVLGYGHLGIMDHGNLSAVPDFYTKCRKEDIEPVLGQEFYFVPNVQAAKADKNLERFHVGIIAKGEAGYRVLSELSTEGHKRFYGKPLVDKPLLDDLGDDAKHLVVLSGCAASSLSRMALGKIPGDVNDELAWWSSKAWDFYIELMHHDTSFDRNLNRRLLRLARRHKLPWAITNDPHYVMEDDCKYHDALLAIQTASDIDDPKRFRFEGTGYHLRSEKEMRKAFKQYGKEVWIPGARSTMEIAEKAHVRLAALETQSWHIPTFPKVPEGLDSNRYLKRLVGRGLKERGLLDNEAAVARARKEMRAIEKVGLADFLLITRDIIRYAERKGIRTGPGRGSVAGTYVGYLIGIHKVDSLRYDLLFERFLNPERPKAPDIDSDFDPDGRPRVFKYIERLYGRENVIRVANFMTMGTKRAFQSLAKIYGMDDHLERNKLSSMIEEDEEGNAILPEKIREEYPDLVVALEALTGVYAAISQHAAGVLILDPKDPVKEIVPEMWIPSSSSFVSQYNLASVEALRLLKEDVLSLRNVQTVGRCIEFVKARHDIDIEPDDWIPDEEKGDKKVYKMLAKGDTVGVFQMEGGSNSRGIKQIKPREFRDIVSCTALYRKGPIEAGSPGRFLKNRKDGKVRVVHESLKPILAKTWGEMIFDEQMLQICVDVAGLSWARADDVKTAMKKKNPAMMAVLRDDLVNGFVNHSGMTLDQAEEMWRIIEVQSAYLFNESHAFAYSLLTYQTAKLKVEYPLEYMAALVATVDLTQERGKEKRQQYLGAAVTMGFEILPPDINLSDIRATPEGDDKIRLGLVDIKGVGDSMAKQILRARRRQPNGVFEDLDEARYGVNHKSAWEALGESGALESLGRGVNHEKQDELLDWQFHDPLEQYREKWDRKLKPPSGNGKVLLYGQVIRVDVKKSKNGNRYRTWKLQYRPGTVWTITCFADDLQHLKAGSVVALEGSWSDAFSNVALWDSDNVRVLQQA